MPDRRTARGPPPRKSRRRRAGRRHRMSSVRTATTTTLDHHTAETFGVHSEVGRLRVVMVCRPGLAHQRLTPDNRAALLFDDVLWVHEAQKDHYDFVLK